VIVAALLALGGLAAIAIAVLLLRSIGPRYRIGRLLSSTPEATIDDAIAAAAAGEARYVRVTGRISSEEEFPDNHNRPLVYRHTRLQVRVSETEWSSIVDEREAVPFGVETRQSFVRVDDAALGDGLVVIPRVSVGKIGDLPDDLAAEVPVGTDANADARLTIEQISAVEHATVVGRPVQTDAGPVLTAGLGRPLIVTILDQPAAMRVLAADHRGRVMAAAVSLAAGIGLLAAAIVALLVGVG
jgi:hypothetical protein